MQQILSTQEQPQFQVPSAYSDEYLAVIQTFVQLVPVELIYNLDETGLRDWEERGEEEF
jgi:hypothetical protein